MSKVTILTRPNRIVIASKGVQGPPGPAGEFPDAPDDGGAYIRVNGAWVQLYAPLALSGDLPDGTVDEPYSAALTAAGGRAPYALGDVLLPPGLDATLADATVTVAGTPTEAWEGDAHIDLSDSLGTEIRRALDVRVGGSIFDALQDELTDAGVWQKLDALYISSGRAEGDAVVNLKSPGTFDLAPINTPPYDLTGFSGNGVNGYLATGYTPTGSGNYKLNDASVGLWVKAQPITSTADYVLGTASGDRLRIGARVTVTTGSRTRINSSAHGDVYTIQAKGLTALRRNNSADYQVFKDGIFAGTAAVASSELPGPITFLRNAAAYSPETTTICAGWIGGSLTDSEMLAIYAAVGRALRSLGAISAEEYEFPSGATTWFNEPRSVAVANGVVAAGGVAVDGSVVVNTITAGEAGLQAVLFPRLQRDDHDNPALLRRASDGRILALYARHSADDSLYSQLSSFADDATAWGPANDIGAALGVTRIAYAQAAQLTGEAGSPVHLFTRCVTGETSNTMHHAVLDESGTVTKAAERILTGLRPYFKIVQNGDSRIDVWCNDGHPGEAATNSLYHFYYEGGEWFDSSGNALGAAPFTPSTQLTRIWDGATASGRSWVWGGEIVGGRPIIAYAVFPSTEDHRYRRAVWDGSSWIDEEICAAGGRLYVGEPYYSGGIAIDPDDENVIYCCRQVDGAGAISTSGTHQLFKFVKSAGSWTGTQMTFGSDPCLRPYVIPGTRKLQYCTGRYTTFADYDTSVVVVDI